MTEETDQERIPWMELRLQSAILAATVRARMLQAVFLPIYVLS
jgi:hypothetical protein